jgi:tRNA threonylcarbamoyladenosine biosynthesis protein TsaE
MTNSRFYDCCLAECVLDGELATIALGQRLEPWLRAGDLIGLEGEMGAGKSVLARGMIQHALARDGQPDADIPSPTYTLVQHYSRIPPANDADKQHADMIWHVDLWRIDDPEDVLAFGLDEAMGQDICIIEWISKLGVYLPPHGLIISLIQSEKSQQSRIRTARFMATSSYAARWNTLLSAAGLIA